MHLLVLHLNMQMNMYLLRMGRPKQTANSSACISHAHVIALMVKWGRAAGIPVVWKNWSLCPVFPFSVPHIFPFTVPNSVFYFAPLCAAYLYRTQVQTQRHNVLSEVCKVNFSLNKAKRIVMQLLLCSFL